MAISSLFTRRRNPPVTLVGGQVLQAAPILRERSLGSDLGGGLKNFYNSLKKKVLSSKWLPHEPLRTGITSQANNFKWKVWKFIFSVSSATLFVCLGYVPVYALLNPSPTYILLGAVLDVFLVFSIDSVLTVDKNAIYWFDAWMAFLTLDFNIILRLIKLLSINVFFTLGFEDFAVLVVYASSLYSICSISVCKLSTNRFYFSLNLMEEFMYALSSPMYERLVNKRNYVDAAVYAAPIIVAGIARFTETIYQPVTSPEQEIQTKIFQQFGNRSTLISRAMRIPTTADTAAELLEIARKNEADDPVDLEA